MASNTTPVTPTNLVRASSWYAENSHLFKSEQSFRQFCLYKYREPLERAGVLVKLATGVFVVRDAFDSAVIDLLRQ